MEWLQSCEDVMFQRWIRPGAAVLELGVGGGRTAEDRQPLYWN
jgi:hypothetical protein